MANHPDQRTTSRRRTSRTRPSRRMGDALMVVENRSAQATKPKPAPSSKANARQRQERSMTRTAANAAQCRVAPPKATLSRAAQSPSIHHAAHAALSRSAHTITTLRGGSPGSASRRRKHRAADRTRRAASRAHSVDISASHSQHHRHTPADRRHTKRHTHHSHHPAQHTNHTPRAHTPQTATNPTPRDQTSQPNHTQSHTRRPQQHHTNTPRDMTSPETHQPHAPQDPTAHTAAKFVSGDLRFGWLTDGSWGISTT